MQALRASYSLGSREYAQNEDLKVATFSVPIKLNDSPMQAMVDTGAHYTFVPKNLFESVQGRPTSYTRTVCYADGRTEILSVGKVALSIDGFSEVLDEYVLVGQQGTDLLLGAHSLELFALAVDMANRRLVKVESVKILGSIQNVEQNGMKRGFPFLQNGKGDLKFRTEPKMIRGQ